MAGGKRQVVAAVRPFALRGELQRLDEHLTNRLGSQQVHAQMRDLRLVEDAAERVRADRQRHLFRRVAVVLGGRVDGVDEMGVTLEMDVEILVQGMDGERGAAPGERYIQVGRRRQMRDVQTEAVEQSQNARMWRRLRLFLIRLVGLSIVLGGDLWWL